MLIYYNSTNILDGLQHITAEGTALVQQAEDAAANQVQYLLVFRVCCKKVSRCVYAESDISLVSWCYCCHIFILKDILNLSIGVIAGYVLDLFTFILLTVLCMHAGV